MEILNRRLLSEQILIRSRVLYIKNVGFDHLWHFEKLPEYKIKTKIGIENLTRLVFPYLLCSGVYVLLRVFRENGFSCHCIFSKLADLLWYL